MMPPPANDAPGYFKIGFTGHRRLANPELIADVIGREIDRLRDERKGKLAAISSIACGGDTLFAGQVLQRDIPWIALLPFGTKFFKEDFFFENESVEAGEARWRPSEACLERAVYQHIWLTGLESAPSQDQRNNAYYEVGLHTLRCADFILAVWDGLAARGKGGTGDMIDFNRQSARPKPLTWIHAVTGELVREV